MKLLKKFKIATFFVLMSACAGAAQAQNTYPVDTINIVVPFAPGGTPDIIARKLSADIGDRLGITGIVENRPGASGQVGTQYVANSPADGSVLLLTATHHVINPALHNQLPYDSIADFVPIAVMGSAPNAFVVHPGTPAETVEEFIALAKERPGELTFASSGTGGANHLSGELLKSMTGIEVEHIPHAGAPQSLAAVLGGHVTAAFVTAPSVPQLVAEGRVRALAITGPQRLDILPDVPTMHEAGVENFEALSWFGLYGPKGLPNEVASLLEEVTGEILASEDMIAYMHLQGLTPGNLFGEEFARYVVSEIQKWSEVAEAAGLEKQ